jgi:hypothetical protein
MGPQNKLIKNGVTIKKLINLIIDKGIAIGSYSTKPIDKQLFIY